MRSGLVDSIQQSTKKLDNKSFVTEFWNICKEKHQQELKHKSKEKEYRFGDDATVCAVTIPDVKLQQELVVVNTTLPPPIVSKSFVSSLSLKVSSSVTSPAPVHNQTSTTVPFVPAVVSKDQFTHVSELVKKPSQHRAETNPDSNTKSPKGHR